MTCVWENRTAEHDPDVTSHATDHETLRTTQWNAICLLYVAAHHWVNATPGSIRYSDVNVYDTLNIGPAS